MDNFKPYRCLNCLDYRWVCADHPNVSWDEGRGCGCGAEGVPCHACNAGSPAASPPFRDIYASTAPRN